MPTPFCDHHESVVRSMGEQRLRGLILESEITKLVADLRRVTTDLECMRDVFASEMTKATENIKAILDDFRADFRPKPDKIDDEKTH